MSLNSPFNINDLTPMNSFSYSTVDKVMLIEFSSLEQTKVSNYFHIHQTGLVMKKLVWSWENWFGDGNTGLVIEKLVWWSSNWFGDAKTGLVMELLRFVPRYFFRYTLFTHKLMDVFSREFTLCFQTKPKKFISDYLEKLNNTWQTLLPIF